MAQCSGKTWVCYVPLALKCIYGWNDEGGEDGDWKEGIEIPGGWERMEVAWPLVCR